MAEKTVKKRMTKQDKAEWEELYEFVRSKVLCYDQKQALPRQMVLRLKGMQSGKFCANNNITDRADYSFKTILYTFKACMPKIASSLQSKNFEHEIKKFNYICAIVENNLNDVYLRMKNAAKSMEKTETMALDSIIHEGAVYQAKTQQTSKNLNDLW